MSAEVPVGENSAALADWVETTLVGEGEEAISLVRIDKLLRGESGDLADLELRELFIEEGSEAELGEEDEQEVDPADLGQEAEADRDERIDLLLEEIERRAELGQNVYPFRVDGGRIVKVDACGESAYFLLLALSSSEAPFRDDKRTHEVELAFDLVALAAARQYLGRGAEGVRFARTSADPDSPDTRPTSFSEAIAWLRDEIDARPGKREPSDEESHERHWEWEEDDTRPILNTYNDAGVDLVVWWNFRDGRQGAPVLLAQCTVQLRWEKKVKDIKLDLWEKWIDFSMVPPQRALIIPFGPDPRSAQWDDRTLDAGVLIDRLRLLELLGELDCAALEKLVDQASADWAISELQAV